MQPAFPDLAKMIDHAILHPTLTDEDIINGCELASRLQIASVCIKPYAVPLAVKVLRQSSVKVGTVIGFPHGSAATSIKVAESIQAFKEGAVEVDMVVNIGKVLSGDWTAVKADICAVRYAAYEFNAIVKIIFENSYLQDVHKISLCQICNEAQVAFVKTSTGFGFIKDADGGFFAGGATIHDIKLMRKNSAPNVQVKASGGIRTLQDVLDMIASGATRIGTASTVSILEELHQKKNTENIPGPITKNTDY